MPANTRENLPSNLRSGVAQMTGNNMADVRVHTNNAQPRQVQPHAYAQGANIHIGNGQAQHLPHEMTHVVQQRQGRVQATNGAANLQNRGRR